MTSGSTSVWDQLQIGYSTSLTSCLSRYVNVIRWQVVRWCCCEDHQENTISICPCYGQSILTFVGVLGYVAVIFFVNDSNVLSLPNDGHYLIGNVVHGELS